MPVEEIKRMPMLHLPLINKGAGSVPLDCQTPWERACSFERLFLPVKMQYKECWERTISPDSGKFYTNSDLITWCSLYSNTAEVVFLTECWGLTIIWIEKVQQDIALGHNPIWEERKCILSSISEKVKHQVISSCGTLFAEVTAVTTSCK